VRAPRLALDCGVPEEARAGDRVEVCLAVANTGDGVEPRVTLTLLLPAGVEADGPGESGLVLENHVTWVVLDLAPGTVVKRCAVLRPREPGVLSLVAEARGACAPVVQTGCSTVVAGIPAVLLEVVDLADPVEVRGAVTYEIRVLNQGSAALTQVRWTGRLPETQAFVLAEGQTSAELEAGTSRVLLAAPLAVLEPGTTAVWRVTVRADAAGESRFTVELTADQFRAAIVETESTTQY